VVEEDDRLFGIFSCFEVREEGLRLVWQQGVKAQFRRRSNLETTYLDSSTSTTRAFRFRAVLTGDGNEEVELART
jgi:hypothetical protein